MVDFNNFIACNTVFIETDVDKKILLSQDCYQALEHKKSTKTLWKSCWDKIFSNTMKNYSKGLLNGMNGIGVERFTNCHRDDSLIVN